MARLIVLGTVAGSVVMVGVSFIGRVGGGIAGIWAGLTLLLAAVMIVLRILRVRTVTIQSIYAALCTYLLIGLMFAAFFAAMDHLGGGDFFAHGEPGNPWTFQYFSFTTLTTLGYGDFTAASNDGRALAVVEALTGQAFLVTLVAYLVAGFSTSREQQR
jgi:hypothetical protein